MDIEYIIRELAKKVENLNIFAAAKELKDIKIFNDIELGGLQQLYLFYLYFYDSIYTDITMKKVSKKVLDNFIREDSYNYYKRQKDPEDYSTKKETDIHLIMKDPKEVKNLKIKRNKK
jgi:hypothetical protein